MKKYNLSVLLSLCLLASQMAQAISSPFRVPTPLEYGYAYSHFPFMRPVYDDACKSWFVDVWGAGQARYADKAFLNKNTTEKQSLAALFFGSPSFTLAQAFPGIGAVLPLAAVAQITPQFDYRENTAWFGANFEYAGLGCNGEWAVGLRARLPFREVKAELDSCCQLSQTIGDFVLAQNELVCDEACHSQFINSAFAYRLDFLANLPLAANSSAKFVNFADPTTNPAGDITMGGVDVTNANAAIPPVNVISVPVGSVPTAPFTLRGNAGAPTNCTGAVGQSAACSTLGLTHVDSTAGPANGALSCLLATGVLAAGDRAIFCTGVNYTPLSPTGANAANEMTLWVVPTAQTQQIGTNNVFDIVPPARTIQSRVNAALSNGFASIADFMNTNSLGNFSTQHRTGIGNVNLELYGNYDWCTCWGQAFLQGIVGATFPTDRRITSSQVQNLLTIATGNRRHFEVKVGGIAGWQPVEWFALKLDAYYNWALRRKEQVAAPIKGATVVNIGTPIAAKVSWQYFVGDADFTFTVPCVCPQLGFNVGYQAWVKRQDKVSLDVTSLTTTIGGQTFTNTLDATVLEANTKRISHVVKGEIFHQACSWQLFAGFNHAFAGKNSPNNSDWYLGFYLNF